MCFCVEREAEEKRRERERERFRVCLLCNLGQPWLWGTLLQSSVPQQTLVRFCGPGGEDMEDGYTEQPNTAPTPYCDLIENTLDNRG